MLTSRQRLLGAMAQEPIDRVPISVYELIGWNEAAWENHEPSYQRLMDVIRSHTDCIYMTSVRWRKPANPLIKSHSWFEGESKLTHVTWHTPKGDLTARTRVDAGVHTTWRLEHLLKDITDIDKYLSMPWELGELDMSGFYAAQERLGQNGVMMLSVSDPICAAADLFEMGDFLTYAITEPDRMQYFLDAIFERQQAQLAAIVAHDVRDVMFRIVGPEYATPPYLGPDHFRRFVGRYLKHICTPIREAHGFARVHSHGKIGQVLDQIVDAGAQGLDPIEPPPDGDIEMGTVKKRYGNQLCLFGNIELKELENASVERVDSLVCTAMEQAKGDTGFVLMPTAAPINVPLAAKTEVNILRYIEAGLRYGRY